MRTLPIYCSGCRVVGLGAIQLPDATDPARDDARLFGLLCAACGATYAKQLAAGSIRPGQVPAGLDKRPKPPPKP